VERMGRAGWVLPAMVPKMICEGWSAGATGGFVDEDESHAARLAAERIAIVERARAFICSLLEQVAVTLRRGAEGRQDDSVFYILYGNSWPSNGAQAAGGGHVCAFRPPPPSQRLRKVPQPLP